MKKLFKTHIKLKTIFTLVAIYFLLISGCEQASEIIQSVQNVTPVAADFTFIGLTATANGSPVIVSIMPKKGKSQGDITIYYEGINGTVYSKNVIAPSAAGKYAVTFDVEAAEGFNAAKGLKAGTLTISVKSAGIIESDDEDDTDDENTDDDLTDEGDDEEDDDEITEEIDEPLSLIDFEDSAWTVKDAGQYKNRKVTFKGHEWSVSGVTSMGKYDHYIGSRGIRFRGSADDVDNVNRLELVSFLSDGIESISFDYASFSTHQKGVIELYYQNEGDNNWIKAGEVTAPKWTIDNKMQNAVFYINKTGNIRFKIEKVTVNNKTPSTSVNIDNILITTY
jgi:hypothetical protein